MFDSVLVVCVGNICRSPVGERLLQRACPRLRVESAGIAALVGHGADKDAAAVAGAHGVDMAGHAARQLTGDLAADFDLLLVLEKGHRDVVGRLAPAALGKTMLLGQWSGQGDIADPYRRSRSFHEAVFDQLQAATDAWATRLEK